MSCHEKQRSISILRTMYTLEKSTSDARYLSPKYILMLVFL